MNAYEFGKCGSSETNRYHTLKANLTGCYICLVITLVSCQYLQKQLTFLTIKVHQSKMIESLDIEENERRR
ncbi:hypothetical protein K503DRAFT_765630 [Rhizopogon vinicolor AM-OR11-026]|uniref:Uncharacterized protein n=1 Tax=Rhizopogon vinicolor AM-OR11-026 TaxID=1314800 RepID=A0A1B7NFU5_9AGAM|nr:hypothetical protein K503DRAFT_765630 [Rhizopogon vinicolor AM-OR11-026]